MAPGGGTKVQNYDVKKSRNFHDSKMLYIDTFTVRYQMTPLHDRGVGG